MVEAGAVAAASAESTTEKANGRCRMLTHRIITRIVARKASASVIRMTRIPFLRSVSSRKNSPVEKAMKASAISGRKSMPETIVSGTRFRQKGPMMIPATI